MHFAKNMRYLRLKNKLSQEYVADKLGYKNYTTVQKWENGDSEPNVRVLKNIAEMFNVSMDELLNSDLTIPAKNIYGDHEKNLEYFKDKPELLELYKDIHESETLALMFDKARDLEPEDLESVLMIIRGIRHERGLD